jgi:histidyl-tRNA synthetase
LTPRRLLATTTQSTKSYALPILAALLISGLVIWVYYRRRTTTNPLRVLDCKKSSCRALVADAPSLLDGLCPDCEQHFQAVRQSLDSLNIAFTLNRFMVRGLDYYQRTVFELVSNKLGAQNALCGGGRYDNLVQELGGTPTPAVGFAFGLERAVAILKEQKLKMQNLCDQNLLIVTLGEPARHKGMSFVHELRLEGLCAQINLGASENLKNIMKKANDGGFQYVLIIGDTEIEKKAAVLKEMASGKQTQIKFSHLIPTILKQIKKVN